MRHELAVLIALAATVVLFLPVTLFLLGMYEGLLGADVGTLELGICALAAAGLGILTFRKLRSSP
jgi:hypothetical protein